MTGVGIFFSFIVNKLMEYDILVGKQLMGYIIIYFISLLMSAISSQKDISLIVHIKVSCSEFFYIINKTIKDRRKQHTMTIYSFYKYI